MYSYVYMKESPYREVLKRARTGRSDAGDVFPCGGKEPIPRHCPQQKIVPPQKCP